MVVFAGFKRVYLCRLCGVGTLNKEGLGDHFYRFHSENLFTLYERGEGWSTLLVPRFAERENYHGRKTYTILYEGGNFDESIIPESIGEDLDCYDCCEPQALPQYTA